VRPENSLGLKQEELAQIGGVNRNTQGSYEKDERRPDSAYLSAIAAAGIDVLYVITGVRTPTPIDDINAEEESLLKQYRSIPTDDQKAIRRFLKALADDAAGSQN
jgi:transcriptional regulator with XRE-family HTH domain